ncbi:unnamed protein product, partial [Ixodes persulcatus]
MLRTATRCSRSTSPKSLQKAHDSQDRHGSHLARHHTVRRGEPRQRRRPVRSGCRIVHAIRRPVEPGDRGLPRRLQGDRQAPAHGLRRPQQPGQRGPDDQFVISTRVRCGRSLQDYPFNPCLTEAQYREKDEKVSSTLGTLEGELKGTDYPLTAMDKKAQQQLIEDHFLFKEGDRFLQAAIA